MKKVSAEAPEKEKSLLLKNSNVAVPVRNDKGEFVTTPTDRNAKDLKSNPKLQSFSDFLDEEMGPVGNLKRDTFQENYEYFKLGELIQSARLRKGLSQEQLAEKVGMSKSYISRVENGIKDIRYSTMLKIITAMGARLHFTIE